MEQQDTANNRTFVLLNFRSIINCGGDHIYVYILYFQSIFYRQLQYLFVSGARNPLCNWCFFKEKVLFLQETLNPHILVTKDLLQKAFGQRPFRWRLTVCLLCMAHLERMICCLSGMFLEYLEPRTTSNQKPAR